ncbi:hypothetical protein BZ17_1999 [Yersinia pseudotuberculosis IP 32953]|uniref:Uncharacterized protein n=2 Tax=Yersinia pseudotuberculosis TaxID=633 RepID=Q66EY1_YERPS|nr:hypothetical protein [Yersinia pseudotuberculosis]CQD50263.1 Uncharacterised protein [Yersinia intermedia]AJJ03115.1 hypothetical protein BZ21_3940 [Yersinia pseudotuberculosis]AJJ53410.1 hypothetical protein BZ17_1999 [Yersinia pseudotuberculosis IP 32953]AJJ65361.1 hypothetical protein BZ16_4043 [Yersinia pseudotuberculosis PB1/+]AXY35689.1 hypothetical protein CEQ20_21495 [Yersinia pseudotuberculosis]
MSEERTVNTIYPIHTCLFTALQFHGRELLSLGMSNKWLWFENHFNMSFPEFIKKYQQSNVAVAFEIEYIQPFDFFDAKTFDVSISKVRLRQKDSVFEFHHEFTANNIIFARVALYWRILMLSGDDALTAHPGPLGKELIQLFLPEEIDPSRTVRAVSKQLCEIEAEGQLITENYSNFTLFRHQCEVADQWSFVELPTLASAGREQLIISLEDDPENLSSTMGIPIKNIVAKLSCPFFLFDEGRVRTRAYLLNNQPVFVHHIFNISRADTLAAVVVESF